jgi:PHD/YefM family antitoxin component YafN of YafNO toxin-antitoxin module
VIRKFASVIRQGKITGGRRGLGNLTLGIWELYILNMKNIVSATQGQAGFSNLLKQTRVHGVVPVSKNGRVEAFMVSREKMASILETLEFQKNSGLMELVKQDRAGRVIYTEVPSEI